eukprot:SAG31_NODE_13379_length_873_cov_1.722222_2_plen_51_part_01
MPAVGVFGFTAVNYTNSIDFQVREGQNMTIEVSRLADASQDAYVFFSVVDV